MVIEEKVKSRFIVDIATILSSLAHPDALQVFERMRGGVKSSTKIMKELGLTQKRYYTRLRELMSAGLVEKTEKGYKQTVLGEAIYKVVFTGLQDILTNREKLILLNQMLTSDKLSENEKKRVVEALKIQTKLSIIEEALEIKKVWKIVDTYDDLVKTLSEYMDMAKEEIKIASRYTEVKIAEKIGDVLSRNVKMHWIDGDKLNFPRKLNMLKFVFMNPTSLASFFDAFCHPNVSARFYSDLPYSFMVIDGKFGAFEIINPVTKTFIFAVFFEDRDLCEKLNQTFNYLKEKSVEHPFKEVAMKFMKIKL
ncbi:MAG: hypothetical protein QXL67_03085 [Candidatus Bathyarchaeia archaeon]